MGQYFKPCIESNNATYTIERQGCAKMMEWGYLFNTSMLAVVKHIADISTNRPVRYIHAGDYSETHNGYSAPPNANISVALKAECSKWEEAFDKSDEDSWKALKEETLPYILYNHTKKQSVSLREYYELGQCNEVGSKDKDDAIHPLALLCCTEQGLGGGDFYNYFIGSDLSDGGPWLGDEISISQDKKVGFTDITRELVVTETVNMYDFLKGALTETFGIDTAAFGTF